LQSRNKPKPTAAEAAHIVRIKEMDCVVCGASGPSDCHELEQGQWFTSLPLCRTCHMHPVYGWHGQKANWKAIKLDELGALNRVVARLMEEA
jgi:hypothetical protein